MTRAVTAVAPVASRIAASQPRGMLLQRKCGCGAAAGFDGTCEECNQSKLQRKAFGGHRPHHAPPLVHEVLRSRGEPLDQETRSFMETRFGHDFGRVRIHANSAAAESARAVNAIAYTVGQHVVLADGQYRPQTPAGRKLLAHELMHVVQQSRRHIPSPAVHRKAGAEEHLLSRGTPAKLEIGSPDDQYERDADRAADAVTASTNSNHRLGLFHPGIGSPLLQRKPTAQEEKEQDLHNLAGRPSDALARWNKLKPADRDTVLWEMISRYGPDFAADFLNYAKGKKKPHLAIEITNDPSLTPEVLTRRGYRLAGSPGGINIWVSPSGHEFHQLPSKSKPKAEEDEPTNGVQTKCVDPCMEATDDSDECEKCCDTKIPVSDPHCRNACKFACSTKL
jgi:hypothetical protein